MKLFRIRMRVGHHYSKENREELEAADNATIIAGMEAFPSARIDPDYIGSRPLVWFVSDVDIGGIIVHFGINQYGEEVAVEKVEIMYSHADPREAVQHMIDKLELAAARLTCGPDWKEDVVAEVQGWNGKTHSPVVGPHLHQINRLMLLEDCCTDALQEKLDDGWRLVAVCPQESRRPDYVLGRCTGMDKFGKADRG